MFPFWKSNNLESLSTFGKKIEVVDVFNQKIVKIKFDPCLNIPEERLHAWLDIYHKLEIKALESCKDFRGAVFPTKNLVERKYGNSLKFPPFSPVAQEVV